MTPVAPATSKTSDRLSQLEQEVLARLLETGGHGSTGDLEHRLSKQGPERRQLREAWQSLLARGLIVSTGQTSRSSKANPVHWVSLASVAETRQRLERGEPLNLGPRSRISPFAHRAARLAARLAAA
jgi:hypothetical protein